MNLSGQHISKAQYWTEWDERGERLVMPIRRSWKTIGSAFVAFAFASVQHMRTTDGEAGLFDYFLLSLFTLGAVHFSLNTLTSLLAREVIRIEGNILIHGWELLGFKREKRFPLREIHGLSADREQSLPTDSQLFSPLQDFGKVGTVNFDYNGKTIAVGAAIDNAHAQGLVEWIARRSPRSVLDLLSSAT